MGEKNLLIERFNERKTKETKIKLAINPSREYNSDIAEEHSSENALYRWRLETPKGQDDEILARKQADSQGLQVRNQDGDAADCVECRCFAALPFVFRGTFLLTRENLRQKGEIMHGNYR